MGGGKEGGGGSESYLPRKFALKFRTLSGINVKHTGVSARQRAGTFERAVKHDQEALTETWGYLALSSSNGEDD